jgi:hypothetical protein
MAPVERTPFISGGVAAAERDHARRASKLRSSRDKREGPRSDPWGYAIGRFGSGATSRPVRIPRWKRWYPQQATMAALSVHSSGDG